METCRIYKYSPDNIYARNYYNACTEFDRIRNKVIAYEQQTDDRESPAYRAMMAKFDYWNKKVPETSNIAGKEEEKLTAQKEQEKNNNYSTSPFYNNDRLDYLA